MQTLALQNRINSHFSAQLELLAFCSAEPTLEMVGALQPDPALAELRTRHLKHLYLSGKPNEAHALVLARHSLAQHNLHLQLQTLDFASVCALRAQGVLPAVLSASAILLCAETQELILQQRGPDVATHPQHWHIFGGAFNPETDCIAGRPSLLRTLQRELLEETGLSLSVHNSSPLLLTREKTSGFIQFSVLGVPLKASQLAQLRGNWEGSIRRVAFAELEHTLTEGNWVASGKAHILCWLALGAQHTKAGQKFGIHTPQQLFSRLLEKLGADGY